MPVRCSLLTTSSHSRAVGLMTLQTGYIAVSRVIPSKVRFGETTTPRCFTRYTTNWHLHLREENGVLQGLTVRGENQIERLHLNRPALIAQRREKLAIQELQNRLNRAIERCEAAEERIRRAELARDELNSS